MRVYHDGTVPHAVLSILRNLRCELVDMGTAATAGGAMGGSIGGMFWRFLVAADSTVDRYIVRID